MQTTTSLLSCREDAKESKQLQDEIAHLSLKVTQQDAMIIDLQRRLLKAGLKPDDIRRLQEAASSLEALDGKAVSQTSNKISRPRKDRRSSFFSLFRPIK